MTQPFNLLFLVLTIGLIARLTRLGVDDKITQPIRDKILLASNPGGSVQDVERDPLTKRTTKQQYVANPPKLKHRLAHFASEMLDCSWCFSVWVSAEVVGLASYAVHEGGGTLTAYWWLAAAGTASLFTGVLTTWLYSKDV